MGLLSRLFGKTPRISVLEVLAEKPESLFSVSQIRKYSEISKRESYLVLRRLASEGLVIRTNKNSENESYKLNTNDLRSSVLVELLPLVNIGELEAQMKLERGLPHSELLPESIMNHKVWRAKPIELHISIYPTVNAASTIIRQLMEQNQKSTTLSEWSVVSRNISEGGESWKAKKQPITASPVASA